MARLSARRVIATVVLTWALLPVVNAADDIRTSRLEQDILELQRQQRQQERRIEALERELAQAQRGSPPIPAVGRSTDSSRTGAWTNMSNWDRLKPGMPELEVVLVLGPPTSLRDATDGSRKTLFYAMEIGTGSFLMGSIVIAAQRIVEIHKPTFK